MVTFRRVAAVAVFVPLLAACSPSMEEAVAQHRPAVEKVFDQIRALEGPVASLPLLTEDKVDTGGATIILDADEGEEENALYIFARDLGAPEAASYEGNGAIHVGEVELCGEALTEDDPTSLPAGTPLYLEDCARAEYIFVLRSHNERAASVSNNESFETGLFEGDVLLFRLSDGAHLGGFRVQAENSDVVSVEVDSSGVPIDPTSRLNSDLQSMVFSSIFTGLRTHVPGAIEDA